MPLPLPKAHDAKIQRFECPPSCGPRLCGLLRVHASILTTTHTLVLPAWEMVFTPTESSRPCSSLSPPSPLLKPLPRAPASAPQSTPAVKRGRRGQHEGRAERRGLGKGTLAPGDRGLILWGWEGAPPDNPTPWTSGRPGPASLLCSQAALGRQTRHLSHLSPLCRAEQPKWAPLSTCHKVSSEAEHSNMWFTLL